MLWIGIVYVKNIVKLHFAALKKIVDQLLGGYVDLEGHKRSVVRADVSLTLLKGKHGADSSLLAHYHKRRLIAMEYDLGLGPQLRVFLVLHI